MNLLFWVESLLGAGHLQRALVLARAMVEAGLRPTLATGSPLPAPLPQGARLLALPAVRAADAGFSGLVDASGRPVDDAFFAARRHLLEEALHRLAPRVILTEMFPFGRRAFAKELLPLLEAAGSLRPRPRIVASVRDVLVARDRPERALWMRDLALRHYDRVLVHGDPLLIPFAATFPHAAALGTRLAHTGYVVGPLVPPAAGPPEVLVSAGGGAVGRALLEAAIAARPLSRLAAAPWRLLAGRALPEPDLARLAALLPPGMALERHRDDFQALLANCLLSLSQAGYNTVVEGLRAARPMVLVPFARDAETEQTTRAARLALRGRAVVLAEADLSPARLAAAIDAALARSGAPGAPVDLEGAACSARLLADLARGAAR